MWFLKNKQANRRLGKRELLDVKARSVLVRKRRLRWSVVALALSFGTIFFVYLAWRTVNWALDRFVYQNPASAVRRIDVYTDGVISPEQIRLWAGIRTGQNLLALDLPALRRNLELVPYIKMATVERVLPSTVRIRVVEREPLAVVYTPQKRATGGFEMQPLFLDADGYLLAPLDKSQCTSASVYLPEQYPVILGINPAELVPGRKVDLVGQSGLKAALELIVAFDRSPMVGLDSLQSIDISSPGVLEVTTQRGSRITFAVLAPTRQLRRLREIYELGQRLGCAIASVDLAVSDNIPVRWAKHTPHSLPGTNQQKRNHTKKPDV